MLDDIGKWVVDAETLSRDFGTFLPLLFISFPVLTEKTYGDSNIKTTPARPPFSSLAGKKIPLEIFTKGLPVFGVATISKIIFMPISQFLSEAKGLLCSDFSVSWGLCFIASMLKGYSWQFSGTHM